MQDGSVPDNVLASQAVESEVLHLDFTSGEDSRPCPLDAHAVRPCVMHTHGEKGVELGLPLENHGPETPGNPEEQHCGPEEEPVFDEKLLHHPPPFPSTRRDPIGPRPSGLPGLWDNCRRSPLGPADAGIEDSKKSRSSSHRARRHP